MLAKRGASAAAQACRRRTALVGNGMMVAFPHPAVVDTMPMLIGAREVSSVTARHGGRGLIQSPTDSVGFVTIMDVMLPWMAGPSDSLRWMSSEAADKALTRKQTMSAVARVAGGNAATVGLDAEETTAAGIEALEMLERLVADLRLLASTKKKLTELLGELNAISILNPGKQGEEELKNALPPLGDLRPRKKELIKQRVMAAHESGALGAVSNGVLTLLMSNKGVGEACIAAAQDAKKLREEEAARLKKLREEESARKKKLREEEAARQEERAKAHAADLDQSFDALKILDSAICSPRKEVLEQLAQDAPKCLPEASVAEVAEHIMSNTTGSLGLSQLLDKHSVSPDDVCIPKSPENPARWVLWDDADDRHSVVAELALMMARLMRTGTLRETNGAVLLGPRGTGKSAMLRVGAMAAGVLSRAVDEDKTLTPVVPVVLDMGGIRRLKDALERKDHYLPKGIPSLEKLVDRALQKAGYRDRIEELTTGLEWLNYPWLGNWGDIATFLRKNGLTLLLVVDEADNYFMLSTDLGESLASFPYSASRCGIFVSGSAAWMHKLLFDPYESRHELAAVGYLEQDAGLRFAKQHDHKLRRLAPLRPMETLEELIQAVEAVGDVPTDLGVLIDGYKANKEDSELGAALGEALVNRGAVMRMLLWDGQEDSSHTRPLSLSKMVSDISGEASTAVVAAFLEALRKHHPGMKREDVGRVMVGAKQGQLRETASLRRKKLQGDIGWDDDARGWEKTAKVLSGMADAGLLSSDKDTNFWWPSSWAAVAAMLQASDNRTKLTQEQRNHLAHPTNGAKTTEPVLVHAFMGLKACQVQAMDGGGVEELDEMFRLLAEAREAMPGFPMMTRLPETGLSTGTIYCPSQDMGVDAFVFVRKGEVLWAVEVQCKAGGLKTDGTMHSVPDVKGIVNGFVKQAVASTTSPTLKAEELVKAFPKVKKINRVHAIVTNKNISTGFQKEDIKEAVVTASAELDSHDVHGTVTVSRRWIVAGGKEVVGAVYPEVREWAEDTDYPWAVANWEKANPEAQRPPKTKAAEDEEETNS